MELVGTHQVFSLLLDHAVLICRNQFWRYRGIDDIEQRIRRHLTSHITHQIAYERLGHTGIHTVHRHMVAIIRGPSQSQFGEVASTHHQTIHLIGHIHQYLRTLTGLTVLIGYVMHTGIVTDILEMLLHRLGDADLADSDSQGLHQCHRIIIGTIGSTESRHRDADDTLAVKT